MHNVNPYDLQTSSTSPVNYKTPGNFTRKHSDIKPKQSSIDTAFSLSKKLTSVNFKLSTQGKCSPSTTTMATSSDNFDAMDWEQVIRDSESTTSGDEDILNTPSRRIDDLEVEIITKVITGVPDTDFADKRSIRTALFNREYGWATVQLDDMKWNCDMEIHVNQEVSDFLKVFGVMEPRVSDIVRLLKGICADVALGISLESVFGPSWVLWKEKKRCKKLVRWHTRGIK